MSLCEYEQRDKLADETAQEIVELFKFRFGEKDSNLMFRRVMGQVLKTRFHERNSLSENDLSWSMDFAVANHLGPQLPRIVSLHQWLVEKGHDGENPWDVGYCDRYASWIADQPDFKAMAIQTHSLTYMVVLVPKQRFADKGGELTVADDWAMHIRVATTADYSRKTWRPELHDFKWLELQSTAEATSYLRYGDCRDRGYVVSLKPSTLGEGWDAEHVLVDYRQLTYLVYDLASLIDSMRDEE